MKYCTNCGNELKENSNFCTKCGKPTKKELEKIKKIEKEKKEQANEKLLLWLGTFLVIISSIIFAFTNWENMNDIFKVIFLSIEALIFFASSFAFKKLKNDGAYKTMWFLGTIFIIVILNFIGEKELLGNYLSYKGSGIYVYLALSSALCALIYYLSSKFMKSKTFLLFGHVFLYLMVISLLYLFKMDKIYSESLILPVLCLFNLIIIIINIFVKNKQIRTFMSIISLIFVPITLTYSVIYSDSVINSIIPFVFELISLFTIIKTEKNNPLNCIFAILIYVLTLVLVPDTINLFTSSISIELFITILSLALLYFILTIISDKSISVMSYILTMILSYLNIFCYSIRPEVAIIMTLIIGVIQIFTIKFNDEKIKKTISELLLPITMFILIYNIFEVFIDAKLELILLVASILCFLINTFINKNEKETVINSIFEAFAFIFLSVSSIVIIFNGNSLTAFLLNELLWIYYFIYVLINKNIKSENIVMLILTICNLFLCSIRLNIKLYYVLLFVTGIIALIYMFSDKIKITLSSADLEANDLDLHSFMSDSSETQSLFLSVLDKAEKDYGFITDNYQLKVETYALDNGTFMLTITRSRSKNEPERKKFKVSRKVPNMSTASLIYRFNTFEDFCNFAEFLSTSELGNVDKISKSSLLYSYNDYYYLIFNDVNVKYPNLRSFYSAITEFGTYIEYSDALAAKLHETATLIIKNHVVKVATKYFVK